MLLVKVLLVFGLLALVLWVLKRTDGLGGKAKNSLLEVRGSTRLGKGATLTIVRVDGKDLVLGVTDHAVTLLTSELAPVEAAPVARKALLSLGSSKKVPDAAVAAALATLRGEDPTETDGSVPAPTRFAPRRRVARMDALPHEEHLWNRSCRPAFRVADGDDALA